MNATIKGMIMDKTIRKSPEGDSVYCFELYQKGNRNLIQVKDIPFDMYENTKTGAFIDLDCKLTVWSQGSKNGVSVKYIGVDSVEGATK